MAGPPAAPGGWRTALYRDDAPGAVLDSQPWARSWPEFLAAVTGRDSSARQLIANAMSERVPSEGGFLVPEYLRSQVMAYITPAIMRPRAMVLPMASARLPIPTLDNPSQANGGQVLGGLTFSIVQEGEPIPSSTPAFGRTVLNAWKLAALMTAPNELSGDAAGAFGDFLARVVALGNAWAEDDLFIGAAGTGAGSPESVMNAPCAVQVTRANTSDPPVLADIVAMTRALHPASKQAGFTAGITDVCWLISASAWDALLELYLTVGTAPTSAAVALSDWLTLGDGRYVGPALLGLPAIVTDHQPAAGTFGDVVLADLRHYLIGDRLTMTVEQAAEGSGFASNSTQWRIRNRVDGRYWIRTPTTTAAGQTVSPVVVLD
jgi:HK97 family phage major capsid protein